MVFPPFLNCNICPRIICRYLADALLQTYTSPSKLHASFAFQYSKASNRRLQSRFSPLAPLFSTSTASVLKVKSLCKGRLFIIKNPNFQRLKRERLVVYVRERNFIYKWCERKWSLLNFNSTRHLRMCLWSPWAPPWKHTSEAAKVE